MKEKGKRLLYLDLIRTFAVVCVFVVHFTRQFEYDGIARANDYKILRDSFFSVYLGSYGVSLFFIVSGASLMYVYKDKFQLGTYLKKRFWGIYPMYWIAFILAFLYNFYINKGLTFACEKWTILLTVLGMDGYLSCFFPNFYLVGEWFMGCIILLYLIFPILRKGVLNYPKLTAAISLTVYVLGAFLFHSAMPTDTLFILRVPELLVGMYFVCYFNKIKPVVAAIAAGFLAICAIFDFYGTPTIWIAPVVGVASFIVLTFIADYVDCKLVRGITQTVGKYCFAIFLTHHFVIAQVMKRFYCFERELRVSEVWLLFFVCCIVTAIASKLLYELNRNVCGSIKGMLAKEE